MRKLGFTMSEHDNPSDRRVPVCVLGWTREKGGLLLLLRWRVTGGNKPLTPVSTQLCAEEAPPAPQFCTPNPEEPGLTTVSLLSSLM